MRCVQRRLEAVLGRQWAAMSTDLRRFQNAIRSSLNTPRLRGPPFRDNAVTMPFTSHKPSANRLVTIWSYCLGMTRKSLPVLMLALLCAHGSAIAATVDVEVSGTDGKPAVGAIVSLVPVSGATPAPTNIPADAVIDQRNQMFSPLAVTIRRGGRVVFANNDTTMHQVYSFSSIKQFEYPDPRRARNPPTPVAIRHSLASPPSAATFTTTWWRSSTLRTHPVGP